METKLGSHKHRPWNARQACRSYVVGVVSYSAAVACRLRVIDLFAGAGGLTAGVLATERFELVAAVENDVYAAATYAANFGEDHTFLGDVSAWTGSDLPGADVVIGGPPCQGFSNLGTRNNRDPRNALWRRYVDVVAAVKPSVFVMENVDRFLQMGQYRDLKRETYRNGRLRDYRLEADVLNAADYGAPQLRRRTIILGSHRDLPAPGLPEPAIRSILGFLYATRSGTYRRPWIRLLSPIYSSNC